MIAVDTIIKNFIDTEKERWRKAIRKSMRTVANKVKRDFVAQGVVCMDAYYNEYDPLQHGGYVRTYNLQDNAIYPYERARKGELDVGVAFSSAFMKPYPTTEDSKFDGDDVANLVVNNFMEGIHGNLDVYVGSNVHAAMDVFTASYRTRKLDKYFSDINFERFMK